MSLKNKKNNSEKIWYRNGLRYQNTEEKSISRKTDMVSVEYERCIRCHKQLNIPLELEIDLRPFYVDGAGQLCYDCFHEIYG